MQDQELKAKAAADFGRAADQLVNSCRVLEQYGLPDEPTEALLQSLEAVTQAVHRMVPPPNRIQIEPADAATVACRVAARQEAAQE